MPDSPDSQTTPAQPTTRRGSIRLFRLFGIDVFLHWAWIIVAIIEFRDRRSAYINPLWPAVEYCTLFLIVLMHEFGHALACRSVGGTYVAPPRRPGALLWSIVAGPLVNVILIPVTFALNILLVPEVSRDLGHFLFTIAVMNVGLLIFNLLPIYPLDGGQIVRALLWFIIGQARSLMVAAIIGMVGAGGFLVLMLWVSFTTSFAGNIWFIVLGVFGAMQSYRGFVQARMLSKFLAQPRRAGLACPSCGAAPIAGPIWRCECGQAFDPFVTTGVCPNCSLRHAAPACPECGQASPLYAWYPRVMPAPMFVNMAATIPAPPPLDPPPPAGPS